MLCRHKINFFFASTIEFSNRFFQPKLNGKSPASSPTSTSPIGEEEDDATTTSTSPKTTSTSPTTSLDRRNSKGSPKTEASDNGGEGEKPKIQERPLPELPNKK